MPTYLLKLSPIDRFYFGSDITFGESNANYLVRSLYFPQQTTILGTMRYLLLKNANLINEQGKYAGTEKNKKDLIGLNSFNDKEKSEFGIIEKLSPVFLIGPNGEEYFVQSREFGWKWRQDEVSGDLQKELVAFKLKSLIGKTQSNDDRIHFFDGYSSKTELPDLLVNARTGQMKNFDYQSDMINDSLNGIFVHSEQVGIRLSKTRGDNSENEKGFYKQIGYRLLPDYSFAFFASLNIEAKDLDPNMFVQMGADRSWFKVSFEEKSTKNIDDLFLQDKRDSNEQSLNDIINRSNNIPENLVDKLFQKVNDIKHKVVLLSDCIIDPGTIEQCRFASLETIPFRYIAVNQVSANIKTENVSNLADKGDYSEDTEKKIFSLMNAGIKLSKSDNNYIMVKKGSVLYVDSIESKKKILGLIAKKETFHQIGYNYAI